jgi:hypothetical protein
MRPSKFIAALILATSFAHAAPPNPVALGRYAGLWNNSPFTTKPIVEGPIDVNPFEDYALGGVTPVDGGDYLVTLFNKKKPEERIRIPGNTLGLKVKEVHPGTKPLSTTVMITNGVKSGLVGFDDKLLAIKAPVAAKQQPGQPNGQPVQPGQANNGQPVPQPQIQPPNLNNPNAGARPGLPVAPGSTNGQNGVNTRPSRPRVVPVPPPTR